MKMPKKLAEESLPFIDNDFCLDIELPEKIIMYKEELNRIKPDWKEIVFELAKKGASEEYMYTSLGLTRTLHFKFMTDNEYKEWFFYCLDIAKAWWLELGRRIVMSKDYNNQAYSMIMCNKYKWYSAVSSQVGNEKNKEEEKQKLLEEITADIDIEKFKKTISSN